ncbi:Down syndrome cell adhesion molecule-like protein Dscam2 [Eumeta japonica]|uniref:Down syndrome cell adhesion molecule-like protein Dscam2 n=1 Tax=Eumeta variegata TaxID=151549 RepID=A0A4C1SAI0_EUMVA|nr:Down syndrome cell adhesion molecule-like protein Dscam2 [Eumeta japonica]
MSVSFDVPCAGPPSIRALGPVRVVAGANTTVLCPYAGYPIRSIEPKLCITKNEQTRYSPTSSITWWARGSDRALPSSGRVSAKGPELRLSPPLAADAGPYACSVVAPDGTAARRDIELQVRNPPKISPFIFSSELTEGSSAQVLCGVSSGDKPMYFSWLKDGAPIPTSLQLAKSSKVAKAMSVRIKVSEPYFVVEIVQVIYKDPRKKSLDEFSLLMFSDLTAKHSGAYTCSVSNHAATVNYTANLSVKVTPTWISEPLDLAVLLGAAPISLECSANGYPFPTITWYRKLGDGLITNDGSNEQWEEIRVMDWNSDNIRTHNGTLKAAAAARAHQGVYRCRADNGVGPPLMKQINVTVHDELQEMVNKMNDSIKKRGMKVNVCKTREMVFDRDEYIESERVEQVKEFEYLGKPAHFDTADGANVRNLTCVRGQGAALACRARGDAPLRVHWMHRGRRLDSNSYRTAVSEVRTADGLRSTLQLRAAERADAGEYRCHAENEYGRSEMLIYLYVEGPGQSASIFYIASEILGLGLKPFTLGQRLRGQPPEAPKSLQLSGASSRWIQILWKSSASRGVRFSALYTALHTLPGSDVRQRTLNLTAEPITGEDRLDADGVATFTAKLEDLRPATAYSLRLAATNHVGQSPHSEPLLFTTLEEAPTGSPQNIRVRPSGAGDLHVSWSAPTQDSWNGELLGYVISWRELGRFDDEESDAEDGRKAGTATSPGWSSSEITINGLRKFSRYAVSVRAYNSAGAGPPSQAAYATTADGGESHFNNSLNTSNLLNISTLNLRLPEVAPTEVRCEALSARTLRVRWAAPPGPHAPALRGYDVHYAPLHFSHSWSGASSTEVARAGLGGEATLQGLRLATNYSVSVHARNDVGPGPASTAVYCTTLEDVPGAPEAIKALPSSADGVLVTWLAPAQRGGRLSHYTLYTRELGKTGAEWSQRVETKETKDDIDGEVTREVRGLREGAAYEFWVRGATVAGSGEPSRTVNASPKSMASVSARIASFGRRLRVAEGSRLRLRCHAVGGPPLARAWAPLPRSHTITENGDLLIHRVERTMAGNYTCSVRNSLGADSAIYALSILLPPAAPSPRLARAEVHALHVAWDPPQDGGAPLLGYTVWWSREASAVHSVRVPGSSTAHTLEGLACGAQYRITLRAHNMVGASPHSRPLTARTRGDKAKAPRGKEFIWANNTHLRFNLLAWNGRCPVSAWMLALRDAEGGPWRDISATGEAAENLKVFSTKRPHSPQAGGLRSGAWYEVRVVAKSAAGDATALYRAATHALNGGNARALQVQFITVH